jgi:tetratricopeptide (TPR) repeat protein
LLADPDWRCVWFDETAGVYVPNRPHKVGQRQALDFTDRYFTSRSSAERGDSDLNTSYLKQVALLRIGQELLARENAKLGRVLLLSLMGSADGAGSDRIIAAVSCSLYGRRPDAESPSDWQPLDLLAVARVRRYLDPVVERGEADFETWFYLVSVASDLNDRDRMADVLAGMRRSARTFTQRRLAQQLRGRITNVARSRSVDIDFDDPLSAAESLMEERKFLSALQVLDHAPAESSLASQKALWADRRAKLFLIAGKPESAREVWSAAAKFASGRFSSSIAATYLVERRYDHCLEWCGHALQENPENAQALCIAAVCHLELGDAEATADACHAAIALAELLPHEKAQCDWILELVDAYGTPHKTPEREIE